MVIKTCIRYLQPVGWPWFSYELCQGYKLSQPYLIVSLQVCCLMNTGWDTCTLLVFSPLSVDFEQTLWDRHVCSFKSFWAFPYCCDCFGGLTPSTFLSLSFVCLSVCLPGSLYLTERTPWEAETLRPVLDAFKSYFCPDKKCLLLSPAWCFISSRFKNA